MISSYKSKGLCQQTEANVPGAPGGCERAERSVVSYQRQAYSSHGIIPAILALVAQSHTRVQEGNFVNDHNGNTTQVCEAVTSVCVAGSEFQPHWLGD